MSGLEQRTITSGLGLSIRSARIIHKVRPDYGLVQTKGRTLILEVKGEDD
jgi:hypothetical protein